MKTRTMSTKNKIASRPNKCYEKPVPVKKPVEIHTLPPEKIAQPAPEVSDIICHSRPDPIDPKKIITTKYKKGKFLGKGGFAKCYELMDVETDIIYAGKIVPKSLLVKSHQRDKMAQEIAIHRELKNKNVVKFLNFFEDNHYVYIVLELCRKRSMMELHKRRKALTEPEVRFYMRQIVDACCYLHNEKIIHRDLKLGNLFLDDDFTVKIGDFGLATKVECEGQRKKTLCGTPNYIAPEVLQKKGHSYEVDVWSLGCILYTLLVGKPPFETTSLKETYQRIKKNEYYIPSKVSQTAQLLIIKLLRPDPEARPSMQDISRDIFLTAGFIPPTLPNSSLTMAPRFSMSQQQAFVEPRKAFTDQTQQYQNLQNRLASLDPASGHGGGHLHAIPESGKLPTEFVKVNESHALRVQDGKEEPCKEEEVPFDEDVEPSDFYLSEMLQQLKEVIDSNPCEKDVIDMDEAEDPALTPVCWISKWVDYSDKYGLGYQLCDGSVGVLYNDATRLLCNEDGKSLQYIDRNGMEEFFQMDKSPETLYKKKTLLEYFSCYMSEHLLKTGDKVAQKGMDVARLPFLRVWFRTRSAIIMHLNCGILQINFFTDHTKIVICPKMNAVSYIDEQRNFRTFKLKALLQHGCSRELFVRLRYAKTMVERLIKKLDEDVKKSGPVKPEPMEQEESGAATVGKRTGNTATTTTHQNKISDAPKHIHGKKGRTEFDPDGSLGKDACLGDGQPHNHKDAVAVADAIAMQIR